MTQTRRDLAPEVAPALGQPGGHGGEGAGHRHNCRPTVNAQAGSARVARRWSWKRPNRRRVRAIRDRLREMYGQPVNEPHGDPIGELVKTVLSQHTNDRNRDARLRGAARALPDLGGSPRRAGRRARRGDPPRRPGAAEGAADPGDPRAARRPSRPRLDRDRPARGVARVPPLAARGRPQNRGLRADLHLGHPGDPGRRPRPPGRRPARPLPAERLLREAPTTRCWRSSTAEDAYELHMNLIRHGRAICRPETALRGVRAAADVPLVPCRAPAECAQSKTFIIFGLLVVFLAVLIPWSAPSAPDGESARRSQVPTDLKDAQVPLPDQLRQLPHALRGGHRRQLRSRPRRTARPGRPAGRPGCRGHDRADRRPRPQRDRKRRRRHDHAGPDAGRHPQRRAGRRSLRIRRPHRRRGLNHRRRA